MVEPSKWPLVGSVAALITACGSIWFMHGGPWYLMAAGFVIMFYTFFGWWKDVIAESLARKYHTDVVSHGLRV
ncbi:MAG TPA: cytochrome c oxidase subunit 3, partial [Rhodospirillaceae bacterium]|nr:cytochrome c oxidase subunit 3 [Rhodospirillaceae bacterium]